MWVLTWHRGIRGVGTHMAQGIKGVGTHTAQGY